VERILGAKYALILGGLPYPLFVISAGIPYVPLAKALLLLNGAILGMGAALFWVAHGDFIVRNAKYKASPKQKRIGLFSGLFFSIFSLNGLFGNLLNGWMKWMGVVQWMLFGILGVLALAGVLSLVFLVPMPRVREEDDDEVTSEDETDDTLEGLVVTESATQGALVRGGMASASVGAGEVIGAAGMLNEAHHYIDETLNHHHSETTSEAATAPVASTKEVHLTPPEYSHITHPSTSTAPTASMEAYNPLPSPASQGSILEESSAFEPAAPLNRQSERKSSTDVSSKRHRPMLIQAIINVYTSLLGLIRVFFDPKMLLFTPISFYSGASLGFFQGNIPPLFGEDLVPWVMAVFSLCSGINAIVVGRLSDIFSKRLMMCFTFAIHITGAALTFTLPYMQPYSFFWTMAVCGMSDAALNTMIYSYLGTYFEKVSAEGFAVFKFVQSLSAAISFFGGSFLKDRFLVAQIIIISMWAVSAACFVLLEFFIAPVDKFSADTPKKSQMSPSVWMDDDPSGRDTNAFGGANPEYVSGDSSIAHSPPRTIQEKAPLQRPQQQSFADYGSSSADDLPRSHQEESAPKVW